MPLTRDAYRELEDILGVENISEDPVILDGYSYQRMGELRGPSPDFYFFGRFEAVVLPGSTADVQKVMKWCNRHRKKSIAISTGYGPFCVAKQEDMIMLDMRRMNRILEIDEKNMYVVVEPYVSFAQVQAAVMKYGLNCHVIGAGSNTSVLASCTSHGGPNAMAISQGSSGRNLLGIEWVLPTGEIVRVGSPGGGAGWFSGDGPGPSIRGIIRGALGADGGLGVFTKCALHLHPWPGPTEMEINGISPYYETEIPPNFEYHMISWPSWERCADAQLKIGESGIAYVLDKTGGPGSHGSIVTGSNNEYWEKWEELKQFPEVSLAIVIAGTSPQEHEYQRKTLNRIMEETEGKIVELGENSTWKKRDFINMIKACFIPRLAFRPSGNFNVDGMAGVETADNCAIGLKLDSRLRDKYAEKKIIVNDGTVNNWAVTWEGAHFSHFECGHQYDPLDEASSGGMLEMMGEGEEICLDVPIALAGMAGGDMKYSINMSNYPDWMKKIKKTLDPNSVSDPHNYITVERPCQYKDKKDKSHKSSRILYDF